jgi:hypothetical protein
LGEGVREGPAPQNKQEDKQSVLSEGGGSMEKEEEGQGGHDGQVRTVSVIFLRRKFVTNGICVLY